MRLSTMGAQNLSQSVATPKELITKPLATIRMFLARLSANTIQNTLIDAKIITLLPN